MEYRQQLCARCDAPGQTFSVDKEEIATRPLLADLWQPDETHTGMIRLAHPWVVLRLCAPGPTSVSTPVVTISLREYGHDMRNQYIMVMTTIEGNDPMDGVTPDSRAAKPTVVKSVLKVSLDKGKSEKSKIRLYV